MKKLKDGTGISRALLLSLIALILTAVLIPMEIIAWFAVRKNNTTEDFELGVVGESEGGGVINVFLPDGSELGEYDLPLLPGISTTLKITVSNVSEETHNYKMNIIQLKVLYPTSSADFSYGEEIYGCPDYFDNLNAPYDVEGMITEELFKRFVSPVSDALLYDMYYVAGNDFADGYTNKYLSSSGSASAEGQSSATGIDVTPNESYIPISTAKSKTGQTELSGGTILVETGVTVNQDGSITLESGKSLDLYLIIRFDPNKYVTANVGDAEELNLTLKNSNPYYSQHLALSLDFKDE